MKFSKIARGHLAREQASVTTIAGDTAEFILRPVLAEDDALILEGTRKFVIKHGEPEARVGDPLYDLGIQVHTLVLACMDAEAPEQPFFDGGIEQVMKHLDRDRIALIYQRHERFQDEVSPRKGSLSEKEFFKALVEIAASEEGDDRPFDSMRPGLLRSFARTTARQLVSSLGLKSLFSSSPTTTPSPSTDPDSAPSSEASQ